MEINEYPTYDGTLDIQRILIDMEGMVIVEQRILSLDLYLKSSRTKWWDTHKGILSSWDEFKIAVQHHFLSLKQVDQLGKDNKKKCHMLSLEIYDSISDPFEHIEKILEVWKAAQLPSYLWKHQFFNSLGTIPKSWYVHEEIRKKMHDGRYYKVSSFMTFLFLVRLQK
jgi:hypothetical protein